MVLDGFLSLGFQAWRDHPAIDRHKTAELLGFSAPTENAMDSVSDRDYSLNF